MRELPKNPENPGHGPPGPQWGRFLLGAGSTFVVAALALWLEGSLGSGTEEDPMDEKPPPPEASSPTPTSRRTVSAPTPTQAAVIAATATPEPTATPTPSPTFTPTPTATPTPTSTPTPRPTATPTPTPSPTPTPTPVQHREEPEYHRTPAPVYPQDAIRDGAEGTVKLDVLVGRDGRVHEVEIYESSGDERLDLAAWAMVRDGWEFDPAIRDGDPIEMRILVPIEFRLTSKR